MARLDVPTFEDPAIRRQLQAAWSASQGSSIAWDTIRMTSDILTTVIQLFSQVSVSVVSHQRDVQGGRIVRLPRFFDYFVFRSLPFSYSAYMISIGAATTADDDYLRMQGYKHLVDNPIHRKEVVAGSLGEHLAKRTLFFTDL
ncbi:hypothetical protein JVT61DRAFT_6673 [Boletus reticuloceps]|uniref:Uncharacterized protein n=1 Tax=Boletus reticuloceps TaxID=495285 RepID=A0A8I2YJ62_9AGAM|nr:hypothetical protein JVT61DRAFT_6673 [Boletus reticuloceps]